MISSPTESENQRAQTERGGAALRLGRFVNRPYKIEEQRGQTERGCGNEKMPSPAGEGGSRRLTDEELAFL